jgi:hypothetical protein
MLRYLAPALLSLFVLAGCSNASSDDAAASESQVRSETTIKTSVRGLRFGEYRNRETPVAGQFVSVTMKNRVPGMSRRFYGSYEGIYKDASGDRAVSGNFQIVRKYVQQPHIAGGRMMAHVVKFFAADGTSIVHEARYMYVGNTAYLTTIDAQKTMELDLVKDAAGNTPFERHCTLSELFDDNVFEESLSEDEYPDLDLEEVEGKFDVSIGAASFDEEDSRITVRQRSGGNIDLTIDAGEGAVYRVTLENNKGTVQLNGGDVAEFSCR